jgi:protein required for attachment to host cells
VTRSFEPLGLLRRLADEYRHVEQEHGRQPASRAATRHRLAEQMRDLAAQFERVLEAWTPADELRARWREYLHGRSAAPDEPHLATPLLFKGRTDAGAIVEIRATRDGYDILTDGARSDHQNVPWDLDPDTQPPVLVDGHLCDEIFDAPPAAIAALRQLVAGGAPPWRWARELVDDGLIDPELALTPRGRRCLFGERPREPAVQPRNVCVLVADAARARVLVLAIDRPVAGPTTSALVEMADLTNPLLRARDSETLADSGMGRRGGTSVPVHASPDHRDHRRRDAERHFAAVIAEQAASVWRRYPACELIVAASPVMLGLLRPAIDRQIRAKDRIAIHEMASDLSKLSAPMLQDLLADSGLLPPRGRRAPLVHAPGLPI